MERRSCRARCLSWLCDWQLEWFSRRSDLFRSALPITSCDFFLLSLDSNLHVISNTYSWWVFVENSHIKRLLSFFASQRGRLDALVYGICACLDVSFLLKRSYLGHAAHIVDIPTLSCLQNLHLMIVQETRLLFNLRFKLSKLICLLICFVHFDLCLS